MHTQLVRSHSLNVLMFSSYLNVFVFGVCVLIGADEGVSSPENRSSQNVKRTLQRVLEAHALLASKLQNDQMETTPSSALETVKADLGTKNTISMAREVLAGFSKGSVENDRVGERSMADNGNGVQVWGASLTRSGLAKPLTGKGNLWKRDLGTVHGLHSLTDQPYIVQKACVFYQKLHHDAITAVLSVVRIFLFTIQFVVEPRSRLSLLMA